MNSRWPGFSGYRLCSLLQKGLQMRGDIYVRYHRLIIRELTQQLVHFSESYCKISMTKIVAPRSVSNRYRVLSSAAEIIHSFEQRNISGSSRAYPFVYSSLISRSRVPRATVKMQKALMSPPEIVNSTYFHGWPISVPPATCLTLCSVYCPIFFSLRRLLSNWTPLRMAKKTLVIT